MFLSFVYTQNWFWFGCEILITIWISFFYTRTTQLDYNVLRLKTVAAIYELFVMKCSAWKSTGFSIKVKTSNGFKPVL